MGSYLAKRLLLFVPTLIGATLAVFLLLRVLPGDVALVILAGGPEHEGTVTPERVAALREKLGTDRPLHEQYLTWVTSMARLDFGRSLIANQSVAEDVSQRLPVTFQLATMSIVGATLLGIPLGILMALRASTWVDYALRAVTIGGLAVPTFFVALLLILFLVDTFNWIPPLGFASFVKDPRTNVQQVILPVLILSYSGSVVAARLTRSTMIEILNQEYILTARAKGLPPRLVTVRHAVKNALPLTVAFLGTVFVDLMNGTVVLEKIFVLPGIGSGLVDGISTRDYPVVEATLFVLIVIVLTANLLIDLIHARLDPRITLR